jgi:hypothetical protein
MRAIRDTLPLLLAACAAVALSALGLNALGARLTRKIRARRNIRGAIAHQRFRVARNFQDLLTAGCIIRRLSTTVLADIAARRLRAVGQGTQPERAARVTNSPA